MSHDVTLRRQVARLTLDLFDARITDKQFFAEVERLPIATDPKVAELVELVRHAGARSWFFGVGRRSVADDGDRIGRLVAELMGEPRQGGTAGDEARA